MFSSDRFPLEPQGKIQDSLKQMEDVELVPPFSGNTMRKTTMCGVPLWV